MKPLFVMLLFCLVNMSSATAENKTPIVEAFLSLINHKDVLLLESSHCKGLLNETPDKTIGDLLSSFLAMPSENEKNVHVINSSCESAQYENAKKVVDVWDCRLTVTEKVVTPGGAKEDIIASMMFAIIKIDNELIKTSLRSF